VLLPVVSLFLTCFWPVFFRSGVSAPDANTVFAAGGDNGVGANVMQSTDGGKTWNSVPIEPTLMLLAIDAGSATHAVVSGLGLLEGGSQYLSDGVFLNSTMVRAWFGARLNMPAASAA
jgi:hypothetical protein